MGSTRICEMEEIEVEKGVGVVLEIKVDPLHPVPKWVVVQTLKRYLFQYGD
jgi:hypothetical protein